MTQPPKTDHLHQRITAIRREVGIYIIFEEPEYREGYCGPEVVRICHSCGSKSEKKSIVWNRLYQHTSLKGGDSQAVKIIAHL